MPLLVNKFRICRKLDPLYLIASIWGFLCLLGKIRKMLLLSWRLIARSISIPSITISFQNVIRRFYWNGRPCPPYLGMKSNGCWILFGEVQLMVWDEFISYLRQGYVWGKSLRDLIFVTFNASIMRCLRGKDGNLSIILMLWLHRYLKLNICHMEIFLNVELGHNPNFTWRSIWASHYILVKGCR